VTVPSDPIETSPVAYKAPSESPPEVGIGAAGPPFLAPAENGAMSMPRAANEATSFLKRALRRSRPLTCTTVSGAMTGPVALRLRRDAAFRLGATVMLRTLPAVAVLTGASNSTVLAPRAAVISGAVMYVVSMAIMSSIAVASPR